MSHLGPTDLRVSVSERGLRLAIEQLDCGLKIEFPVGFERAAADLLLDSVDDGVRPLAARNEPVLAYAPVAQANKFQALLYSKAGAHGVRMLPLISFDELHQLPLFSRLIIHFHWFALITSQALGEADAREKVRVFLKGLDELSARSDPLYIWTAHNVIPHDSLVPDADRALRQEIIDRCTAIHCLTEESIDRLDSEFKLDRSKIFVVGHPSYCRAYPDFAERNTARNRLGIAANDRVILGFGAIKQYKGFRILMDVFEVLAARPEAASEPWHLLIAGAGKGPDVAEIAEWASERDDVSLICEKIADEDLQYVFRASDVAVCPYNATLNSGVAILALAFGVPVVAPALPAFTELGDDSILTYEPGQDSRTIAQLVVEAVGHRGQRVDNKGFNVTHDAAAISDQFFEKIGELWAKSGKMA